VVDQLLAQAVVVVERRDHTGQRSAKEQLF
jgi:hypothetical protein